MARPAAVLLLVAIAAAAVTLLLRSDFAAHAAETTRVPVARHQSPDGPVFGPPMTEQNPYPAGSFNGSSGTVAATGVVPGVPATPSAGQMVPATAVSPNAATTPSPAPQAFESAQILARVGTETILASDVVPLAEEALQQKLNEIPEEQRDQIPREQYERLTQQFTKVLLEQLVEVKIRYADAVANIPKENLPHVKSSINESFDKSVLKKLMTKYGATTRGELEAKMAADGQSLDRQRQMFLERSLAGGWENQHVKENREVPVSEILGYYQQHIADFEYPSKARWEELMTSFDQYNSRDEAGRAIVEMGNEVLRGADFAAVARARSHGPTRLDGGAYDWTTKGSLASQVLDEAVFGLPVGRMSQILEGEHGFHIVRVIERVEAGRKPFLEAQAEIRQKLRDADIERQTKEFLAKMKERTPVWTIFDSAPGGPASPTDATPADATLGGRATAAPR